jgi:hypothetical protein
VIRAAYFIGLGCAYRAKHCECIRYDCSYRPVFLTSTDYQGQRWNDCDFYVPTPDDVAAMKLPIPSEVKKYDVMGALRIGRRLLC